MSGDYSDLAPISRRHEVGEFRCSSEAQTDWLLKQGIHNRKAGTSVKPYVITESSNPNDVVAYFAWCMSGVPSESLPSRFTQGAGDYPMQPFLLLARLGVHIDHEGRGLGSRMLGHVIRQTYEYSKEIGCRGLLIHAETKGAVEFYRRRVAEFESALGDEHHLVLLAKDIGKNLTA